MVLEDRLGLNIGILEEGAMGKKVTSMKTGTDRLVCAVAIVKEEDRFIEDGLSTTGCSA